ncbi:MAG: hypothetical protein JNK78_19295 [Planctomycetes bacterium]|nr:hypothetical protein [Planctomycetota bacterium]
MAGVFVRAQSDGELAAFAKLPPAAQEIIVASLRDAARASTDPVTRGLSVCVAEAATPGAERASRQLVRHPKRAAPAGERLEPVVPMRVHYVFGVGAIESVDATPAGKVAAVARADAERRERHLVMQQALAGLVPDADAALAAILRRLDTDVRGDTFAAFLHSWRNGDESFYEALDRTAGTPDSVFFYDAMLHDFTAQFAHRDRPETAGPTRSLQAAHDALHEAFLQYRRYRSFREAVAYSLVLPPEVPLPPLLRRFDEAPAGSYAVRAQVLMLRELFAGDVAKVVAVVVESAPPLPDPLWLAGEDPLAAWQKAFAALVPKMVTAAGNTDALLARARTRSSAAAAAVSEGARSAVATTQHPSR